MKNCVLTPSLRLQCIYHYFVLQPGQQLSVTPKKKGGRVRRRLHGNFFLHDCVFTNISNMYIVHEVFIYTRFQCYVHSTNLLTSIFQYCLSMSFDMPNKQGSKYTNHILVGCDWWISILVCLACQKMMSGDVFRMIAAMHVTLK